MKFSKQEGAPVASNTTRTTPRKRQPRSLETETLLLESAAIVFARLDYNNAKLTDISDEAGVSVGSLYFHFGNKDDVASAVLTLQQTRMTEVFTTSVAGDAPAVDRMLVLLTNMAALISVDKVVQAGIRLLASLPDELKQIGHDHYRDWQNTTTDLIREGLADGSVTSTLPAEDIGELLNEIFVGAQVMSGMSDGWKSLPARLELAMPLLRHLLQPE